MENNEDLLVVSKLSYGRGDAVLFKEFNVHLSSGQLLEIMGRNGSGKTTLLRIICGFIEPDAGEIRWRGRDIHTYTSEYQRDVSYVGHLNGIKLGLTPFENLTVDYALSVQPEGISLLDVLEKFGLAQYKDIPAQKLSSGQRRRLALARLQISGTYLWLLDEPYTSLDEEAKTLLGELLHQHLHSGGAAIMASHDFVPMDNVSIKRIVL